MAYKITEECISCGACEPECKNQAIKEGECAEVCPVDCCVPDPDHKESKEQLLEKWKKQNPGKTPEAT
jgi:formate hydrogenlyase subunit 6/NADH:ubiquinone oxidoreductase subunit I